MLSQKDLFVSEQSANGLWKLKCTELLEVAAHYKLSCSSSLKKDEIRRVILEHLREEEIISDEDGDELEVSRTTIELKKLEFQENERARENTLRIKELEVKEKELALQVKLKELEARAHSTPEPVTDMHAKFDISKHVRFVLPFQEQEIDKYFLHFEKVATSLDWPKDVWTFLLQSVLVGKARICSSVCRPKFGVRDCEDCNTECI